MKYLSPVAWISRFVKYNRTRHTTELDQLQFLLFDMKTGESYAITLDDLKELLS